MTPTTVRTTLGGSGGTSDPQEGAMTTTTRAIVKTAIVTGASRGIGHATALALAEDGFNIAAVSLPDPERMDELGDAVRRMGRRFASYAFDLADLDSHAPVLAHILDDLGGIDCLVNNAGVSVARRGDLLEVTRQSFDRCLDVNTRGTFFWTQAVAKTMVLAPRRPSVHRSIVFVTSSNAVAATVERGEYCLSKTALSMAAKLYAVRMAEFGVGVYEVQPGLILTEMTQPSKEKYDTLITNGIVINRRWGKPEDVARVIRSMAAGLLPYTVAQDVRVDGGLLLTRF
jgi:NAD(P)-dependent dehydrogenase (short-subunit alcohol dehydrogenase family)